MIRRLEIENFMCLKNVSVELEPLTVFVGPNGSGKSAIFKALVTLSKLLNGAPLRGDKGEFSLEPGVTLDSMVWNGDSSLPIRFKVWFGEGVDGPDYTLELSRHAAGWSVNRETIRSNDGQVLVLDEDHPFFVPTERGERREFKPPLRASITYMVHPLRADSEAQSVIGSILRLGERFGQAWRYRPSASDIAASVSHDPKRKTYVGENGRGVVLELQALQGERRDVFEAIERDVCRVFPHIKRIAFKRLAKGVRLCFSTDRSQELVPAPQESDGVLLATFLFWRLYTSNLNLKVCLEEPENGLHPFLLGERFKVLKSFTRSTGDRPGIQLFISTHSPEFLRAVKAHPTALWKEIRLVEFSQQDGSCIKMLSSYPAATKLIEQYHNEINERWNGILKDWDGD